MVVASFACGAQTQKRLPWAKRAQLKVARGNLCESCMTTCVVFETQPRIARNRFLPVCGTVPGSCERSFRLLVVVSSLEERVLRRTGGGRMVADREVRLVVSVNFMRKCYQPLVVSGSRQGRTTAVVRSPCPGNLGHRLAKEGLPCFEMTSLDSCSVSSVL